MLAEEFEGMNSSELAEQAEARGIQPFRGERKHDLCLRMAAYDQTITAARYVALQGIKAKRGS